MLVAFVIGGVTSVAIGVATTGLHRIGEAANESAAEGRLTGGGTDPNYLGAGLVASTIVAMTLFAAYRRRSPALGARGRDRDPRRRHRRERVPWRAARRARRGAIAAFIVFKRGRLGAGRRAALLIGLAAIWVAADPSALTRLTNFSGTGTGRTELWKIAWRVGDDNPMVGVGLGNFAVEAVHFVRAAGRAHRGRDGGEEPHVAHNMYLQAFAETGSIGFGSCCVRGDRAARYRPHRREATSTARSSTRSRRSRAA